MGQFARVARNMIEPTLPRAIALLCAIVALAEVPAARADPGEDNRPTGTPAVRVMGNLETGITIQPDARAQQLNFGQITTDRAGAPLLNQMLLTIDRPIDPAAGRAELGFRVTLLYGSDARFTRLTGQFGGAVLGRTAFDALETDVQAHLPVGPSASIDIKLGQYVSPVGFEIVAAADTLLYSHGYILSFSVPIKHAGLLTVSHIGPHLDIYAGVDAGSGASIERDNNRAPAVLTGFGLTFARVMVVALAHIGPELPGTTPGVRPDSDLRYYTDAYATWHVTDRLMAVTEVNYVRDNGLRAEAGGVAQYFTYMVRRHTRLAARAEIWRDGSGAFVAAFPRTNDAYDLLLGRPNSAIPGPPATYSEVTLGLTQAAFGIGPLHELRLRPELRYDRALAGRPFDQGRHIDQFTFGLDIVVPFAVSGREGRS